MQVLQASVEESSNSVNICNECNECNAAHAKWMEKITWCSSDYSCFQLTSYGQVFNTDVCYIIEAMKC